MDDINPFIRSLMIEWGDTYDGYSAFGSFVPKRVAYVKDVNVQYVDEQIIHPLSEPISANGYWDNYGVEAIPKDIHIR